MSDEGGSAGVVEEGVVAEEGVIGVVDPVQGILLPDLRIMVFLPFFLDGVPDAEVTSKSPRLSALFLATLGRKGKS